MKALVTFTVFFAFCLTANSTPFVKTRIVDEVVTFQGVNDSGSKKGLLYAMDATEAWASHDDGAAMEVYKPVLLTTDSVYKLGEYIPFETGADESYCRMLGYRNGAASGDRVKNPDVVLATIHDGKILVGSAAALSRITGRKVYAEIRSITCD